jgi:hypothetical protein
VERLSSEGWYGCAMIMTLWANMLFNGDSSRRLVDIHRFCTLSSEVCIVSLLYLDFLSLRFIAENLVMF